MTYVDGFVLLVHDMKAYKKMASGAGKVWKKHGALSYVEAVGDDLHPKMGGMKSPTFPKMAKQKKGEKVVFSFITYKSRKHRDQVNAKVMKDPFMCNSDFKDVPMPFDMKRMAFGGFKAFVDF